MLNVSKPSANRLDLDLTGKIDADAMRAGLETLLAQSEGMSGGTMLYRIADFEMPTPGALVVELQLMPKLFSLIGRFSKCAVLCDTGWIRSAAEIEGALFPGLEIKSFTLSGAAAAEAWLGGGEPGDAGDDAEDENFPV